MSLFFSVTQEEEEQEEEEQESRILGVRIFNLIYHYCDHKYSNGLYLFDLIQSFSAMSP